MIWKRLFLPFFVGLVYSIDVNLNISEKVFEEEFHKSYASKADEDIAGISFIKLYTADTA